jgi:hypothetical protein
VAGTGGTPLSVPVGAAEDYPERERLTPVA